jgi:hypothetical protein
LENTAISLNKRSMLGAKDITDTDEVPRLPEIHNNILYRKDLLVAVPCVLYTSIRSTSDGRLLLIKGTKFNEVMWICKLYETKGKILKLINRRNNLSCL